MIQLTEARVAAAALDRATVARVTLGDPAVEQGADFQRAPGEPGPRDTGKREGHSYRAGPRWFSFDLAVAPDAPMTVLVSHFVERGLPAQLADFEVQVDGTAIGRFDPRHDESGFYEARYHVPPALTTGKQKDTVRSPAGEREHGRPRLRRSIGAALGRSPSGGTLRGAHAIGARAFAAAMIAGHGSRGRGIAEHVERDDGAGPCCAHRRDPVASWVRSGHRSGVRESRSAVYRPRPLGCRGHSE